MAPCWWTKTVLRKLNSIFMWLKKKISFCSMESIFHRSHILVLLSSPHNIQIIFNYVHIYFMCIEYVAWTLKKCCSDMFEFKECHSYVKYSVCTYGAAEWLSLNWFHFSFHFVSFCKNNMQRHFENFHLFCCFADKSISP